jgi:hypothetical protein
MIGTMYEPSGWVDNSSGMGSSRDSATAPPTSSMVETWLTGRPNTAAASRAS